MSLGKRQRRTGKDKRLDIRDVASHAGVSIATVSRTINAVPTVDKELAARVWRSIAELNYFPNTQARALVSGKSRLLGLLISEITNPFFPELIQGFEEVATEHNYEILIGSTNYDTRRMEMCIRRMIERHVEGVAVMTFGIEGPLLDELVSRNIPMVFVDAAITGTKAAVLLVDYQQGFTEAVRHLHALGHTRIGFITGPMAQRTCELRLQAYRHALELSGLDSPPEWIVEGNHSLSGGMAAMEKLLKSRERPTAVLCSNDLSALGVLRSLASAGIAVPGEMSVVGFDDIDLTQFVYPPLTSIRMSRSDLARGAFSLLRAQVEGAEPAAQRRAMVPTSLTVRESTGPAVRPASPARRGNASGNPPGNASGAADGSKPRKRALP